MQLRRRDLRCAAPRREPAVGREGGSKLRRQLSAGGFAADACQTVCPPEALPLRCACWAPSRLRCAAMPLAHPPIVVAAGRGDLATVERLLSNGTPVDSCFEWTETEDRGFYEKSWRWKADSALCAALHGGHAAVVRALLAAGASAGWSACNACDVHDTPRSIALAVRATHPECADLILTPAFDKVRLEAEAAWAKARQDAAGASLVALAAIELLFAQALVQVENLSVDTLHYTDSVLEAVRPLALAAVHDTARKAVQAEWREAAERVHERESAAENFIKLGELYISGDGVAVDEAAAALWLARGLSSRPDEHIAECLEAHKQRFNSGHCKCFRCDKYCNARASLSALASSAVAGAAAAAALAADDQRHAALLDSPLHRLELLRRATLATKQAAHEEELQLLRAEAKELQRAQDERFDLEVRQPEVERCKLFEEQRRASLGGGACYDRHCTESDYCTYWHEFGKKDLPPRCQWFASNKCRQGDRCWYNHLPRRPPRVPCP